MTEPYDHARLDREGESSESAGRLAADPVAGSPDLDLEDARENVFEGWPSSEDVSAFVARSEERGREPEPRPVPFSTALDPEGEEHGEAQEEEAPSQGADEVEADDLAVEA